MCHLCRLDDADDMEQLLRPSRAEAEELLRDQERTWNALSPEEQERRSRNMPQDPWVVTP